MYSILRQIGPWLLLLSYPIFTIGAGYSTAQRKGLKPTPWAALSFFFICVPVILEILPPKLGPNGEKPLLSPAGRLWERIVKGLLIFWGLMVLFLLLHDHFFPRPR